LIVATKLDKLRAGERAAARREIKAPGASIYGFSTELPETVTRALVCARAARRAFMAHEA